MRLWICRSPCCPWGLKRLDDGIHMRCIQESTEIISFRPCSRKKYVSDVICNKGEIIIGLSHNGSASICSYGGVKNKVLSCYYLVQNAMLEIETVEHRHFLCTLCLILFPIFFRLSKPLRCFQFATILQMLRLQKLCLALFDFQGKQNKARAVEGKGQDIVGQSSAEEKARVGCALKRHFPGRFSFFQRSL